MRSLITTMTALTWLSVIGITAVVSAYAESIAMDLVAVGVVGVALAWLWALAGYAALVTFEAWREGQ
jgi:hypothetical protein